MSLIDVIVGTSVMLIVFLGIFGAFKLSIELVFNTKAKAGAIAFITDQLEYIRGLPYDSVGTVGGIPSGTVPQLQQKTLNGINYTLRTLIQYVDAPEDGLGSADSNAITADYKSVKVEALWMIKGQSRSVFAVTRVSPQGIETLANGGTLLVNIFNALATPIQDATVRIVNASTVPAIDVSVNSDTGGVVSFPGAPPAADYQISVMKAGYSSSTTYMSTAQNPNPNPAPVSVVNRQTTTISFAIDLLGSLRVLTFSPVGPGTYADTFPNQAGLSATSSATVSGGAIVLDGAQGSYPPSGSAMSTPITPPYLSSWDSLSWTASTSASVSALISLYYWNATASSYALIPDSKVPGNSAGFAVGPMSLAALDAATYGTLEIHTALATTDASSTPEVYDWNLTYQSGPTPLPNIGFDIHGTKSIGTTAGGAPLYKMNGTYSSGSYGEYNFDAMEWDVYLITLTSGSHDIQERCPNDASVTPGTALNVLFTLVPHTTNSLRVIVTGSNVSVPNATVTVIGGSVNSSALTSACGQVFFGSLPAATYTVTVTASGYQGYTTDVPVTGATEFPAGLTSN